MSNFFIRYQEVHVLFYLKYFFDLSFLFYHQNLSYLQNCQYHFHLLNLFLLILRQNDVNLLNSFVVICLSWS